MRIVDLSAADADRSRRAVSGVKPDRAFLRCALFEDAERHIPPMHERERGPSIRHKALLIPGCELAVKPAKNARASFDNLVQ
jgi:hypothetical protein